MASAENVTTVEPVISFMTTNRPAYTNTPWSVVRVVIVALFIPTIILILTLNPLCLIVLRRVANIQPTTKIFMASLIFSDFCYGLFVFLPYVLSLIIGYWPFGTSLCIVLSIIAEYLFGCQCFLSLLLLTIDRYLAIAWCLRYPRLMTVRRAQIVLFCSLVSVLIVSVSGNVHVFFEQKPSVTLECNIKEEPLMAYTIITLILVGLVTIAVFHLHILMIARRQARRIAQENQPAWGNHHALQTANTKSFTTVTIIMGVVMVGWIPTLLLSLLDSSSVILPEALVNFVDFLFYTTNWMDAVIFCVRNKEFRQTLCRMLPAGLGTSQKCCCMHP